MSADARTHPPARSRSVPRTEQDGSSRILVVTTGQRISTAIRQAFEKIVTGLRQRTNKLTSVNEPSVPDLPTLRERIDAIDDRILALLSDRAALAAEIARLKGTLDLPFYVPSREREILDRLAAASVAAKSAFPADSVRTVFREILSACLAVQSPLKIAYLGPESTFTHLAVQKQFGLSARAIPCGTISAVFETVERNGAEFGVVPVENSSEGIVSHTLDNFLDSDLKISAEIILEVAHCLLRRAPTTEAELERVYSHPQALAQCRRWLNENLPRAVLVEASSTSEAARIARDDPKGAAIASQLAAKLYDLDIARENIQDIAANVTRFLVIGTRQAPPTGKDKTSLLLALGDEPGCLHRGLEPFATHGVNMTKIESRPSRRRPWEYVFFVDLDGHESDVAASKAIDAVRAIAQTVKVLGSYPRAG